MENFSRMVIDMYKRSFTDYVNNSTVDLDAIFEAQEAISNAITKAKVQNTDASVLEALKADIDYLKYNIL